MVQVEQEEPNWFVNKFVETTQLPVIRHVLRELSRPGYLVGNLLEGDVQNAMSVLLPFSEIDDQEATTVSDVILPRGSHWALQLGVDIATDPLTYMSFGTLTGAGKIARGANRARLGAKIGKAGPTLRAARYQTQMARLSDDAAKIGRTIEDIGDLGDNLATQAAKDQRNLLSFAGHDLIKGKPIFNALTAIGEYSGGSKVVTAMTDMFSRVNVGMGAAFEHALGGRKALLKNVTGVDLKTYNGLVDELTEAQQKTLYRHAELHGDTLRKAASAADLDLESVAPGITVNDELLKAMDLKGMGISLEEARAIAHGQASVERWRVLANEVGLKVHSAKATMKDQMAAAQKQFDGAARRVAGEVVKKYSKTFERLDRAVDAVAKRNFKGKSDREIVELAAIFTHERGQTIKNLAKKSPAAASKRVDELAGMSDDALAELLPDVIDRAEFRKAVAEIKLVTQAAERASGTIQAIKAAGKPQPTLYQVMRNMKEGDTGSFLSEVAGSSDNLAPVARNAADEAMDLTTKISGYETAAELTPSYLHHMLTPEAVKWMAANPAAKAAAGKKGFSLNVQRKFVEEIEEGIGRALSLDEVQKLVDDSVEALRKGKPDEAPLKGGLARKFVENLVDPANKNVAKEFKKLDELVARGEVKNMREAIDKGFMRNVAGYFETDSKAIMAATKREFVEGISHVDYLQSAGKAFGVRRGVDEASDQAIDAGQMVQVPGAKAIEGVYFRTDVANKLAKIHDVYTNPKEMASVLKIWDGVQNLWKAQATAGVGPIVWPGFHGRNAVSNIFLNFFAGMTHPVKSMQAYGKATALQMLSAESKTAQAMGRNVAKAFGGVGETTDDVMRSLRFNTLEGTVDGFGMRDKLMRNKAMSGTDMFNMELGEGLGVAQRAGKYVPEGIKKTWNKSKQLPRSVGGAVEDNGKIAHMIYMMDGGMDELSAGESAISALFDYGDVTNFEKGVMKRLFPFWTWTRKSVPAVAKAAIQHPGRIRNVARALAEPGTSPLAEKVDMPDDLVPAYVADQFGVPVNVDEKGNPSYFLLESWIPMFELNKITTNPKDLFDEGMAMLSPLLKVPLELGINKSFFFEKEIERFEGETTPFIGMNPTKRQKHVMGTVRALNELDNFVRTTDLAGPEYRKRDVMDAVVKGLFGVRLNKVDVERRQKTVDFEHRKRKGQLTGLLRRANAIGDDTNAEAIRRIMASEGIDYKAKSQANDMFKADIKKVEDLDKQMRKIRRGL